MVRHRVLAKPSLQTFTLKYIDAALFYFMEKVNRLAERFERLLQELLVTFSFAWRYRPAST